MIRKTTLILFTTAIIIMSYGGCDGDNERMSLLNSNACRECPCEFQFVPQSEECWVPLDNNERLENIFSPRFTNENVNDRDCSLYAEPTTVGRCTGRTSLIVEEATDTTPARCEIRSTNPEIAQDSSLSTMTLVHSNSMRVSDA